MSNGEEYDKEVDMWSLGAIVFFLLYGTSPFPNRIVQDPLQMMANICYPEFSFEKAFLN
jgi:serine/threonine protein kinase